jgi:hypothetical protein
MSYPCINTTYFDVPIVSPKRHWQWDLRNTADAAAAAFVPASNAGGTVLHTAMATWVNTTGVSQNVYATLTYGACRIAVDQLKDVIIEWSWGTSSGAAPADPTLVVGSRMRNLANFGTVVVSSTTYGTYYVIEDRHPSCTIPLGNVITLPTTQTMKAKFSCRWFTGSWGLNWYTTYGDPIPERVGEVGASRVDIFSTPVIP